MKTNHTITDKGAPQAQPGCKAVLRRLCGAGLLLLLAGCADDPAENILPRTADGETVTAQFSLAPDVFSDVEVKAAGAVDENIVSDVWIIQHKSDGSGQLQNPVYVVNPKLSADGSYRIEVKLTSQASKVYLLANTHDSGFCTATNTKDKAAVESLSIPFTAAQTDITSGKGVLMAGTWEGTPSSTVGIVGAVPLTRAVSKVTFSLSGDLPEKSSMRDLAVSLQSIEKNVYPFKTMDPKGSPKASLTIPVSGDLTDIPQEFTFYLPESLAGVSSGRYPADKNGTFHSGMYIQIEGKYYGEHTSFFYDQALFSIYLGENNINDYNVKRNTHYQVTTVIKGIDRADTRIMILQRKSGLVMSDYTDGYPWVYYAVNNDSSLARGTYAQMQSYCASLPGGGWRLPTFDELRLAAICMINPTGRYWSSTPNPTDPNLLYCLDIGDQDTGYGRANVAATNANGLALCVRDVDR